MNNESDKKTDISVCTATTTIVTTPSSTSKQKANKNCNSVGGGGGNQHNNNTKNNNSSGSNNKNSNSVRNSTNSTATTISAAVSNISGSSSSSNINNNNSSSSGGAVGGNNINNNSSSNVGSGIGGGNSNANGKNMSTTKLLSSIAGGTAASIIPPISSSLSSISATTITTTGRIPTTATSINPSTSLTSKNAKSSAGSGFGGSTSLNPSQQQRHERREIAKAAAASVAATAAAQANITSLSVSSSGSSSSNTSTSSLTQQQQLQQQPPQQLIPSTSSANVNNCLKSYAAALPNQQTTTTFGNLVNNYKLTSDTSDTDTELPRVTDLSESDEESVSEILLACLCLRPDLLDEIPESDPESCGNDGNDDEDDGDDEDEDEDDEQDPNDVGGNFLLDTAADQSRKLTALFEAAANDKAPVLRHATLAIDETKQALSKMRSNNSRDKAIFSRTLIAACTDNDVNTVRRLLGKGNININESTDDGESLLSMACSAGYYELAQVLLAMSAAQVEDKGQKDCTPLMEAASAGHLDIIKLLLSHNADVNAQCTTGNTPLMFACAGGHVDVVKVLLKHGANVEDQNENGHTPLMEAASAGHVDVAKVLLEHGAGINTHSNEFKESALTLACYKGHLNMVRFLLQAGADQEHKTDEMHTALMEASMDGHVEVARLLLDSGAQVNMPTDSFESPLTLAACGGHVELATLLIERGANIEEVNDEGYTPLMEAAREGHEDMVALLLTKGANINATTEETQETALTLACCGGFTEVAEFLIKQGADLELGASTPLMEAAQEGHTDLVRFLLENGANVRAQTQTGDTALTHACENGHTDAAEVLLYFGAVLEHESEGGRTPLMKACRAGHICTVKFLISKGADVNKQTTSNDHTPLSLACCGGHQAVVELLLKSGADPFHKLKDNSTMLIEAAKGGHIRVVETLFKYPQSFQQNHQNELQSTGGGNVGILNNNNNNNNNINNNITNNTNNTNINNNNNNGQLQLQPINLQQQKQLQQQLQQLTAPPGLHEVPEAVRVSNQQIFHQQQFQSGDYLDEQMIVANAAEGFDIDPNTRNAQQQEALIAKMRLFQLQAGFESGLAHGLARAIPGVVNQIINNVTNPNSSNNNNNSNNSNVEVPSNVLLQTLNNVSNSGSTTAAAGIMQSTPNLTTAQLPVTAVTTTTVNNTTKQKSVLRKNRQPPAPAPFELNLTSSEAKQVRSRPLGEDGNSTSRVGGSGNGSSSVHITTNLGDTDEQRRIIMERFEEFVRINEPPPTLLPSAYVDITTASIQGDNNISGASLQQSTIFSGCQTPSATCATTTTTQITTPSEVSQSTAISDRPKVKPVSKKDGKNLRKYAAAAAAAAQQQQQQQNQMPLLLTSEPNSFQQQTAINSTANNGGKQQINIINDIVIPKSMPDSSNFQQALQQLPSLSSQINTSKNDTIFQQSSSPNDTGNSTNVAASSSSSIINDYRGIQEQLGKLALNTQLNQKMLQIVAQNHPLQKTIQRFIVDQPPKSPTESPPKSNVTNSAENTLTTNVTVPRLTTSALAAIALNAETSSLIEDNAGAAAAITELDNDGDGGGDNSGTNDKLLLNHQASSIDPDDNEEDVEDEDDDDEADEEDDEEDDDDDDDEDEDDDEEDDDVDIDDSNSPTKSRKLSHQLENLMYSNVSLKADDISRALCEAVHDFRPDLNPSEIVQVLQPISSLIPHNKSNAMEQQFSIGTFTGQQDENFRMYPVDSADDESIADCGIYPALGESFDSFDTNANDANRDQICGYELGLGECMEEIFSVIQDVTDPAFQELTTNLNCSEFAEFGLNSFCKTRWAGPWVPQQQQELIGGHQNLSGSNLCITDELQQQQQNDQQQRQTNQMLLDQQLLQQLQDRLNVDGMQIYNQIQNQQQTLSLIPITAEEQQLQQQQQQQPTNLGIQSLPTQGDSELTQQQIENNILTTTNLLQATANGIQQTQQQLQQLQQQQQLIVSSNEAQQKTKFLFNVDNDNKPPSLQLLFQLPQIQQQNQQQQQSPAIMTAQQQQQQSVITNNQAIAQTQTGGHNTQITQTNLNLSQQTIQTIVQQQQSQIQQQCAQHTQQVQVATQTQQQPNMNSGIITAGTQFCATIPPSLDGSAGLNVIHQQQPQIPTTTTSAIAKTNMAKKALDKISRKERNRYMPMRQTPPGSQANTTTQQYSTQNTVAVAPDKTIDVDSETDSNHDTALTLACAGGHEELVELLITRGANIEHRDKKGFTPLILAATAGHEKVVDTLLKRGAELEAQSERTKDTPLSLACSGGRYEVVEILCSVGANKEHRNVSDYTPLSLAASGGYVNIIKLLLSHGAEINSRTGSKLGISPLMLAAMNGHTAAVKLLLDMGSDINAQIETNRNTALTLACFQGRHEVVSLLLDRKANVEHRAKTGLTPLMEAASGGYIEVGRVLLDKGADVNAAPVPTSRDTALTIAADKGHLKFVELLLSRGAAVEVKNKKGNSPLWLAAHGGHLSVVEVLYTHGADIDSQDNRRVSCLMAAFRKGHTKVVKWMVQHVTQFPSDQEMTRFISTISDKELLEKCYDCVKIIRAAKEAQAVKANKNASILLEELDMERTREESRRAAAARRRERKKKKKLEKKEEKRRLLEGTNPGDDPDEKDDDKDDSEKEDESDKEDEDIVEDVMQLQEREEGDSGIDQGSCSSTDAKAALNTQQEKSNKNKNKKKKNNATNMAVAAAQNQLNQIKENIKDTTPRATNSPIPVATVAIAGPSNIAVTLTDDQQLHTNNTSSKTNNNNNKKKEELNKHHNKKEQNKTNNNTGAEPKKLTQQQNDNNTKKDDSKKSIIAVIGKESIKNKEKENLVPPKEETINHKHNNNNNKYIEKRNDVAQASVITTNHHHSQKLHHSNIISDNTATSHSSSSTNHQTITNTGRKSMVFSARHPIDKDDHNQSISTTIKSSYRHYDHEPQSSKISPIKPMGGAIGGTVPAKRGEDGWKEVVRKSSTQTGSSTGSSTTGGTELTKSASTTEMQCKKVQVPVHAISRVIGRAGSNINAIRATTGAHIEVEKQGKAQADRSITIKGLPDATKQAHLLITALIKDPDIDILQMLPRVNPNAKQPPPPLVVNSWDKNTPISQLQQQHIQSSTSNTFGLMSSSSAATIQAPIAATSSTGLQQKGLIGSKSTINILTSSTSTNVGNSKILNQTSSGNTGGPANINKTIKSVPKQQSFINQNIRMASSSGTSSTSNRIGGGGHHDFTNSNQHKQRSSGGGGNSTESLSSNTKTTMSFTNAIMSSKNSQNQKLSGLSTNVQATFASKLTASGGSTTNPQQQQQQDNKNNRQQNSMSTIGGNGTGNTNQMSSSHTSSPKKNIFGSSSGNHTMSHNNNSNNNSYEMGNTLSYNQQQQQNNRSKTTGSNLHNIQNTNINTNNSMMFNSPSTFMHVNNNNSSHTSGSISSGQQRSITPIGHPLNNRTISSSPLAHHHQQLQQQHQQQQHHHHNTGNRNIDSLTINTSTVGGSGISSVSAPSSSSSVVIQPQLSQISHGYTLFNDTHQNQWESSKQICNINSNEIDASKAPGYNRGNVISSPVSSSKTSSNSTTPPGSSLQTPAVGSNIGIIGSSNQLQQQQQQQHLNAAASAVSPGCAGTQHSSILSQNQGTSSVVSASVAQQQQNVENSGAGDLNNVLKPISQNVSTMPPPVVGPLPSGLAIQRPNTQNRQSQQQPQTQQQQQQIENTNNSNNFGPIGPNRGGGSGGNNVNNDQPPNLNRNSGGSYFDQISNQNLNQQMNYQQDNLQQQQQQQQQYHQSYNHLSNSQLPMSRLNPRASVFSNKSNQQQQQLGGGGNSGVGMFHQNTSQNIGGLNNYQKLPPPPVGGQQQQGGGGGNGMYNPAPGRPQSQPQVGTNPRWFPSNDYNYMPSSRDMLNLDNGLSAIGTNSPAAMSPNNSGAVVGQANGLLQQQQSNRQQQPQQCDDTRKMPRPIGTERASWKYHNYSVGTDANDVIGNNAVVAANVANVTNLPPWILEKAAQQHQQQQQQQQQHQSLQQQLQPNWAKNEQAKFYDIHPQDHFHLPLDYTVPPPTVNPAAINLMPTFQYNQIPGNYLGHTGTTDITQPIDKLEPWDQDKHGWSSNWTN